LAIGANIAKPSRKELISILREAACVCCNLAPELDKSTVIESVRLAKPDRFEIYYSILLHANGNYWIFLVLGMYFP